MGDFNNDGTDTVGIYIQSTGTFFLRNTNSPGAPDITVTFGPANLLPLLGDWDDDGTDTIGLYAPATGTFFLRNSNTPGQADLVFTFGTGGAGIVPITGDWDGDLDTDIESFFSALAGHPCG